MTEMPAPLTPPDCDLQDFPRMMLDIMRLRQSSFDATADDTAWRAGFNLWMSAFHAVPAASLDNDEGALCKAAALGKDLKTWKKVKTAAMRGWILCSDGRWYHETVAEVALEAWLEKLAHRLSSGAGNAKRWGAQFDPAPVKAAIARATGMLAALNPSSKSIPKASRRISGNDPGGTAQVESRLDAGTIPSRSQGTGTGTGIEKGSEKEVPIANAIGPEAGNGVSDRPAWWPVRDRYDRVRTEITDKLMFDVGKAILGANSGGLVTRMRKAYDGDMRAVVDFLLQAEAKSDPKEWFCAVLRDAELDRPKPPMHEVYPMETHH